MRESAKIRGQFILSGRHQDYFKHLLLVDPEGIVSRGIKKRMRIKRLFVI